MKAETKLKYAILDLAAIWNDEILSKTLTEEEVEELWDETYYITDAINEIRGCGTPTGLDAPHSRHYESQAVGIECPTGEWVGYTYWYGGGKHGNPEEIDWIEHAYDITCVEEQKMMTVQTFSKKDSQ